MAKKLNPKIKKLLRILNDQEFHDGITLGNELGVSRTAIWKFISQLEEHGVVIQSVKGKGYRLKQSMILLEAQEIKKNIADKALKESIEIDVFSEINSTNEYLRDKNIKNLTFKICLAELQHQGRGRLNRQWYSPFGLNIYFSALCEFKKDIGELGGLSLVISLAIVKTLAVLNSENEIKIKWPNDVMYQDKKLAGILLEIFAESNGTAKAIIGIGINVNMTLQSLKKINKPCVSLYEITRRYFDRNVIIANLIMQLDEVLRQFGSNATQWQEEWQKYDYLYNKNVCISNHGNEIYGKAVGINEKGFLLIKHQDGTIKTYSSGDASISKYE